MKKSARSAGTFSLHTSLESLSAPSARDSIVALSVLCPLRTL